MVALGHCTATTGFIIFVVITVLAVITVFAYAAIIKHYWGYITKAEMLLIVAWEILMLFAAAVFFQPWIIFFQYFTV